MGRALVRDPALFLFDEPLSNLDAKLRVEMRTEIKKLHQRVAKTTIYVTHDQVEAMTLASRVAVLHQGALQQFDQPREIYNRPANLFVAGFMGSPAMNFLKAELVNDDGRAAVAIDTATNDRTLLALARPIEKGGPKVLLGIRPEHIARFTGTVRPGFATFEAPVEVVEPTGAETMVLLRLNGHEITARFEPDDTPAVGEIVKVCVDMNKACLFDPETERLLQ
jgi:multiple sugar transport system ATP-binding protein